MKYVILMIFLFVQFFSIPAIAQTVEYHEGYNVIYYEDGSKDIINGALNYLRWDGIYRPVDELNISNGSWPYLYSEDASIAQFQVDDTTLKIPKSNTRFKTRLNSISYELKYSKSELEGKEQLINLTSAFLDIPYALVSKDKSNKNNKNINNKKEQNNKKNKIIDEYNIKYDRFHFKAGKEHIVIHDNTPRDYIEDGKVYQDVTYLNKNDYDFRIKDEKILLTFKKKALDKLKGNVIIEIRTWDIVGANNKLWGGNVTFSSTQEIMATGDVELRQKVDDYALYTRFDEGSGRRIHNENRDIVPEGNLEGALDAGTYTAGKYGSAIYFNGIDNKVLFNDNPAFRLPNDFTIAYYIKLASDVNNFDSDIIRKGSTATANPDSWYKIELTDNIMHGSITKNGGSAVQSYDTQERRDNLWHFVAYGRQSTTCSLAVDGTTVKTTSGCPTEAVNTALLSIGSKDTYVQTTGLDFTEGTIDEVRIYNRKLSSTELASIRNNEHFSSGTVTRNLGSIIGAGEEIKELGCNGTWDRSITKVDILASANNINWDMIQSNAYPDAVYAVQAGNNYQYSRCALSTTDASKTPVIESIRARIGPKSNVNILTAEAGGPYTASAGVLLFFTGMASGGMPPYSYDWNFGDGITSSLTNPDHIYANSGSYDAKLTVTDSDGKTASDNAYVTIAPSAGKSRGSISGFKINDINRNKKWNQGEAGISGWKIMLSGKKVKGRIIEYTDASGFYQFNDLSAGKYTIKEESRKGWKNTGPKKMKIKLEENQNSINNNFTNVYKKDKFKK